MPDTAKPTPGPWTAREGTTTGMEVVATKPRGGSYTVARCGGKDREANAHLIAAAPDLFWALIEALEELAEYEQERTGENYNNPKLNAAIAKAEGR